MEQWKEVQGRVRNVEGTSVCRFRRAASVSGLMKIRE